MTTVLEKAESCREAGEELPHGFTAQELEPYREASNAALKAAAAAKPSKRIKAQAGEEQR